MHVRPILRIIPILLQIPSRRRFKCSNEDFAIPYHCATCHRTSASVVQIQTCASRQHNIETVGVYELCFALYFHDLACVSKMFSLSEII